MDDTAGRGTPEIADAPPRPKGRPGRKPKGSVPVVIPETPDKPDPDHVRTDGWESVEKSGSAAFDKTGVVVEDPDPVDSGFEQLPDAEVVPGAVPEVCVAEH